MGACSLGCEPSVHATVVLGTPVVNPNVFLLWNDEKIRDLLEKGDQETLVGVKQDILDRKKGYFVNMAWMLAVIHNGS